MACAIAGIAGRGSGPVRLAQASSDNSSPAFSLFANLSGELRALIWEQAALQAFERMATYPRENREALAIDIAETADDSASGRQAHILHDRLDELIGANAVFYVNREARCGVLRLIERRKADGLVFALNYLRILGNSGEVATIGYQMKHLQDKMPPGSRRWSECRSECGLSGKDCTGLAISMSNPADGKSTDGGWRWNRFHGPEDFVITLADLFGREITEIYLYDGELVSDFDFYIQEHRALGHDRGEIYGTAHIGTMIWCCPTKEGQSDRFSHLFGDPNRNLMGRPPLSEYFGNSQVYGDEPEVFPVEDAAFIRIPWHHAPHDTMSLTFAEAVRFAAGHQPAFVDGMWSRMKETGSVVMDETVNLLNGMLESAIAIEQLPKLKSISILTPVYDWYIEDPIPESELDDQEGDENGRAGQELQEV
jgi:hypothetical protein